MRLAASLQTHAMEGLIKDFLFWEGSWPFFYFLGGGGGGGGNWYRYEYRLMGVRKSRRLAVLLYGEVLGGGGGGVGGGGGGGGGGVSTDMGIDSWE